MKEKLKKLLMLPALVIFCGACATENQELNNFTQASSVADETTVNVTVEETETQLTETRVPETETVTVPSSSEPTEPVLLQNVEPGAYQLRYVSENSGEYMDYYLYVPNNPMENMPIVVFLHGSGEIGRVELLENYGISSTVYTLYGDDFPFLLLLPCTHKYSWLAESVPETLIETIDSVAEQYHADPNRFIITGHSMGAVGVWEMVNRYSDYFSAAVPVSGGFNEKNMNFDNCAKVPIIAFAGTSGSVEMEYNSAMYQLIDKINKAGGCAQMRIIDGGDHEAMVTAAYTKELFDWLLAQ